MKLLREVVHECYHMIWIGARWRCYNGNDLQMVVDWGTGCGWIMAYHSTLFTKISTSWKLLCSEFYFVRNYIQKLKLFKIFSYSKFWWWCCTVDLPGATFIIFFIISLLDNHYPIMVKDRQFWTSGGRWSFAMRIH